MSNILGVSTVYRETGLAGVVAPSFPHTVEIGTEILLISLGTQSPHILTTIPQVNGVSMELIHQTLASGNNADCTMWLFGMLNPPAGTVTISYRFSSTPAASWAIVDNRGNMKTDAGVLGAVRLLGEEVNDELRRT